MNKKARDVSAFRFGVIPVCTSQETLTTVVKGESADAVIEIMRQQHPDMNYINVKKKEVGLYTVQYRLMKDKIPYAATGYSSSNGLSKANYNALQS